MTTEEHSKEWWNAANDFWQRVATLKNGEKIPRADLGAAAVEGNSAGFLNKVCARYCVPDDPEITGWLIILKHMASVYEQTNPPVAKKPRRKQKKRENGVNGKLAREVFQRCFPDVQLEEKPRESVGIHIGTNQVNPYSGLRRSVYFGGKEGAYVGVCNGGKATRSGKAVEGAFLLGNLYVDEEGIFIPDAVIEYSITHEGRREYKEPNRDKQKIGNTLKSMYEELLKYREKRQRARAMRRPAPVPTDGSAEVGAEEESDDDDTSWPFDIKATSVQTDPGFNGATPVTPGFNDATHVFNAGTPPSDGAGTPALSADAPADPVPYGGTPALSAGAYPGTTAVTLSLLGREHVHMAPGSDNSYPENSNVRYTLHLDEAFLIDEEAPSDSSTFGQGRYYADDFIKGAEFCSFPKCSVRKSLHQLLSQNIPGFQNPDKGDSSASSFSIIPPEK